MKAKGVERRSAVPFVFSNFAMTADGKIAFADHGFEPFSGARDREHMMELRATADAILCGAKTVTVTETILGPGGAKYRKLRLKNGLAEYPLRVVVSGSGSIEPDDEIFRHRFSPIVVLTTQRISKAKLSRLRAVADVFVCGKTAVNLRGALSWLRKKWKVRRLLCEGGGELHGALVRARLVDELHLTICPKIFGGRTAPTIADSLGFPKLAQAEQFALKSMRREKDELFTVFQRRV